MPAHCRTDHAMTILCLHFLRHVCPVGRMMARCLVVAMLILGTAAESQAIGCFTCNSFNNSDPGCEDPFNPAHSRYQRECKQGMPKRVGLFPAQFCIKMNGRSMSRGVKIMVRTCALVSMDHQCGLFKFQGETFEGCLSTCKKHACNRSHKQLASFSTYLLTLIAGVVQLCLHR